jgi:hypothetical protein
MPTLGWRVQFTRQQLPMPRTSKPMLESLPLHVIPGRLDGERIEDGVPSLVSPDGRFDPDLNSYFPLDPAPETTHAAIAYDLAAFLTFLWCHREPLGTKGWRDAESEDRAAYHRWRRVNERGPDVRVRLGVAKSPRSTRFTGGLWSSGLLSRMRYCGVRPEAVVGTAALYILILRGTFSFHIAHDGARAYWIRN